VTPKTIVAQSTPTRDSRPFLGRTAAELTPRHPHTVTVVYSLQDRAYSVAVDGREWGTVKSAADAEELRAEIMADLQERFTKQRRERRARPWLLNGPQAPSFIAGRISRTK
jgi:hypothetical protein